MQMSDYTCGPSFSAFITKLISLLHNQDEQVLQPVIKFVSGSKMTDKIRKKVKNIDEKILKLQEEVRTFNKVTDGEKIKVNNKKIERLQLQRSKATCLNDCIDLSKFHFIEDLFRASKISSNDEEVINNIMDPELKGLMMLMTSVQTRASKDEISIKFEDVLRQYSFSLAEQDFRNIERILQYAIKNVKKYKPKIFNSMIAQKVYKDKKIDFKESKKYCLGKYNPYFEDCFKQYSHGVKLEEILKDKDPKTFPVSIYKSIYSVLDMNNYRELPQEKIDILKKSFRLINEISDMKIESGNIQSFIIQLVTVLNKLKEIHMEERFLKSLIKDTKIVLSNQTKYKLLHASEAIFIEECEELEHYNQGKIKDGVSGVDMIPMKFDVSEFGNLSYFSELTSMKTYSTFGTIKSLKLSSKIRVAVGIRMVSEVLRKLQELELHHNAKEGFTVTITY